jgi:hypothetical protein
VATAGQNLWISALDGAMALCCVLALTLASAEFDQAARAQGSDPQQIIEAQPIPAETPNSDGQQPNVPAALEPTHRLERLNNAAATLTEIVIETDRPLPPGASVRFLIKTVTPSR